MAEETKKEKPEKWTEIEHLPEWDEEFYHVYTAKKHGKWTMLKTLRPEYKDKPEFQAMLEKEFDVRYNLAHPHIIMINDLEEVPGLGMCIITDDVYGDSLRKLIKEKKVTEEHLRKLQHHLLDAIDYIQTNHIVHHPIRPDRILFTENIGNLKLIDVGFDQRSELTPAQASEDIRAFGMVLNEALDAMEPAQYPHLRRIARHCMEEPPRYRTVDSLRMALDGRRMRSVLIWLFAFMAFMIVLLVWLLSPWAPTPPQ